MGLETAHPDALERLNKGCTLDDFAAAARALAAHGVGLRVFLLVAPAVRAARRAGRRGCCDRSTPRSTCGASVVSLIPTRGGNGAIEALAAAGLFAPPTLADARRRGGAGAPPRGAVARACSPTSGISSAFATCPACLDARRARLRAMNLEQRVPAADRVRRVRACATLVGMTHGAVHTIDADVAIVGSGFAGSLTALALRRQGRSVVLLERGRHPRFAIGESSTPLANLAARGAGGPLRPAADPRRSRSGARGARRIPTSPAA